MKKSIFISFSLFLTAFAGYSQSQTPQDKNLFISEESLQKANEDLKKEILEKQEALNLVEKRDIAYKPSPEASRDSFAKEQMERHLEATYPRLPLDTRVQQNRALDVMGLELRKKSSKS